MAPEKIRIAGRKSVDALEVKCGRRKEKESSSLRARRERAASENPIVDTQVAFGVLVATSAPWMGVRSTMVLSVNGH
jgi:hypothetical protein